MGCNPQEDGSWLNCWVDRLIGLGKSRCLEIVSKILDPDFLWNGRTSPTVQPRKKFGKFRSLNRIAWVNWCNWKLQIPQFWEDRFKEKKCLPWPNRPSSPGACQLASGVRTTSARGPVLGPLWHFQKSNHLEAEISTNGEVGTKHHKLRWHPWHPFHKVGWISKSFDDPIWCAYFLAWNQDCKNQVIVLG